MGNLRLRRPSPAMVVATIALFLAIGGAYALAAGVIVQHSVAKPKKVFYYAKAGTSKKLLLRAAGLTLRAQCLNPDGTLKITATSSVRRGGEYKNVGQDEDSHTPYTFEEVPFTPGDNPQDFFGGGFDGRDAVGTLYWYTPGGKVLTMDYQAETDPFKGSGTIDHCSFGGNYLLG